MNTKTDLNLFLPEKQSSPRVKKVESKVKRILSEIFQRDSIPPIRNEEGEFLNFPGPITINHIKISSDLKDCKVFIMPLANINVEKIAPYFEHATPVIRKIFAKQSDMRFIPEFHFILDDKISYIEKLENIIKENQKHSAQFEHNED